MNELKPKLVSLVSYSLHLKSHNANYTSFNLSFMSSVLSVVSDLCEASERELMLKTIVEKLFKDYDHFRTSGSDIELVRIKIFNVRRQICANILNMCKVHAKILTPFLNAVIGRIMETVGQVEATTQMERSILIQALVFCSNETQSYELQLSIVKQFLTPMLDFFDSNTDSFANVDSFIVFIGINLLHI